MNDGIVESVVRGAVERNVHGAVECVLRKTVEHDRCKLYRAAGLDLLLVDIEWVCKTGCIC